MYERHVNYVLHFMSELLKAYWWRADILTYTTTKLFCRIFMVTFKFNAQTETDNNDEFKRKPIISDSHRPDLKTPLLCSRPAYQTTESLNEYLLIYRKCRYLSIKSAFCPVVTAPLTTNSFLSLGTVHFQYRELDCKVGASICFLRLQAPRRF